MCCSPQGLKESDTIERLSNSKVLNSSLSKIESSIYLKKKSNVFQNQIEIIFGLCIFLFPSIILNHSVQFSCSVVSNSLRPHGLQHAWPPCLSPTPRVYSNSCPLSQWCHPTISSSHPLLPPSIFPSFRVFSNESALCIRWPKYWSFSFNISPSNEFSGLISFRIDWLDLLAVQGTLKSLLQRHSSKASILRHSAFFIVQLHIHTWLLP